MSKEIRDNCERMMLNFESRLQEFRISFKAKKSQTLLQKLLLQIINDFKFIYDEFKIISHHLSFLQNKSYEKDILISNFEKELLTKNAEKKIIEQIMKSKYEKLAKEQKFLEFVGKNNAKQQFTHQRCKSERIKKGLTQLQKDIVDSNKRVYSKVKQLQNEIQNQEQRYLTFENIAINKKLDLDDMSQFTPKDHFLLSPPKALSKIDKLKGSEVETDDNITAFKTKKKELQFKQNEEIRGSCKQKQSKSSETIVINIKTKQQLAELIAKQTKIVSRQKYFSTDI